MQNNQEKLKQRYAEYRIKMKSLPYGETRNLVRNEMSDFLEATCLIFGQEVVNQLTSKKR